MCGWKTEINNLISFMSTHIKTSSYKLGSLMMILLSVKNIHHYLFDYNDICSWKRMREKCGLTLVVNICRKISMVDNDTTLFHFCEKCIISICSATKIN